MSRFLYVTPACNGQYYFSDSKQWHQLEDNAAVDLDQGDSLPVIMTCALPPDTLDDLVSNDPLPHGTYPVSSYFPPISAYITLPRFPLPRIVDALVSTTISNATCHLSDDFSPISERLPLASLEPLPRTVDCIELTDAVPITQPSPPNHNGSIYFSPASQLPPLPHPKNYSFSSARLSAPHPMDFVSDPSQRSGKDSSSAGSLPFAIQQEGSGLAERRSTIFSPSSHALDCSRHPRPPDRSAVSNTVPSFLTSEIVGAGDDALSIYERLSLGPHEDPSAPFSSLSHEELANYFAAAADVKHALRLRMAFVALDISDALEALLPKLSIYQHDKAIAQTAREEMIQIKKESQTRNLKLNFFALERLRSILPTNTLSVMERYHQLFTTMDFILDGSNHAQRAVDQFLADPSSLTERRMTHFLTTPRQCCSSS